MQTNSGRGKGAELNNHLVKHVAGNLLVGVALLVGLSACGGSSEEPSPTPTTVQAVPTATATPTATAVPAGAPTPTTPAGSGDGELLARGKVIFEETGGQVGCAYCHGMDGKGDGPAGVGAPANRGATRDRLKWALAGGETDAMSYFKLTNAEMDAVLEYLAFLAGQP